MKLRTLLLACLGLTAAGRGDGAERPDPDALARREMVARQIAGRGVTDPRVLAAMESVPRHLFVPESIRRGAYDDRALPIGEDQTISQPYIVALMTEALALTPDSRVLEIGTGSGYQTAVLARLAGRVYTIEIIPALARRARAVLEELGHENIAYRIGDGYAGWGEHAPYDAIIVTAAPPSIPPALVDQLAEGGRIVVPVGESGAPQRLVRGTKTGGELVLEDLLGVRFVPMVPGG